MPLLPPTMPNLENYTIKQLRSIQTDARSAVDEALAKLLGKTVVTDDEAENLREADNFAVMFCIYTAALRELASRGHMPRTCDRTWDNLGRALAIEEWYLKIIKEGNQIESAQFLSDCGIAPISGQAA
jgi:hypothetical protein